MALDRGTRLFTDPEDDMGSIPYSETPRSVIEGLYASILGRQPDEAGLDYWTSVLASGEPLSNIVNYFQGSTELAPIFQGGFDANNDKNISAAERQAYLNSLLAAPQDTTAGADVIDLIGGTDTKPTVDTSAGADVIDLIGGTDTKPAIDTTPAVDTRSGDTRLGSEDSVGGGGSNDSLTGGGSNDSLTGGGSNDSTGPATTGPATTGPATTGPATTGPATTTTARGLSALAPVPTSTVNSRDVITSFRPESTPAKLAPARSSPSLLRRAEDQPYYNMYQEILGRIPEAEGLAYWKSQFGKEISPTERAAFLNATQGELNAKKAAAEAELAAKNVPPPAYAGPSLTYANQGFNAPVASGLQQALSSGMTRDQYLGNVKNYLDAGVVPGQILSDMTKYGITTDDLIAAKALTTGATSGATSGGAGAGGTPPAGGGSSEPVQGGKTGGAVIGLAEGGEPMTKYTLPDFGLTPATAKGVFNYERDVVFNPEFAKLEALERARIANDPREQARLERDRLMKFGLITSPAEEIASRYWNMRGMKEGGVAKGLGSIAMKGYIDEMAQKGRFGDTMLAHISPDEARMLKAMGGAGTINPETGLPEYFSWKKILKPIAKVLPFVLPFTGIGLPLQALISGVAGGLGGEKGFDFKRGLMSGLMSYGMGSLAQGAGAAGTTVGADQAAQAAIGTEAGQAAVSNLDPVLREGMTASQVASQAGLTPAATPTYGNIFSSDRGLLSQLGENVQAVGQGAMGAATGAPGAREAFTAGQGQVFGKALTPTMAAGATAVGMGGIKAADEMTKFELQQAMINAKTDEERERYRQLFLRTLGSVGFATGGGISALAAGGASGPANQPRTINGAGDGMSDSVPATIEGIQEARLADGEFVIPADVVADLGNGSSNAGSKKLYAMMDRVRKSRHGTTKQPPEINMNRLMPA